MKIFLKMFGGSLVLAAMLLGGSPAANASTSAPVDTEATQEQACWKDMVTLLSACAPTQEELAKKVYVEYGIEFVDQDIPDALVLSPSEKAGLKSTNYSTQSSAASPNAVNATYLLGIYYVDEYYNGSSETMTASLSQEPCGFYGNYTYGNVLNLMGSGFNDNIESFKGYGMCGLKLFVDAGWEGSTFASAGAGFLGAMANQASSIEVYKAK
ncbi:hypothetical protein RCH23_003235 [Cryobacterium sp. CAN_C3]|uniref:hypothetical protein n=1 Tax=unclassified Cryobacterium TaxID=2649013 RepID=UPI0018C99D4C|nr:hypothetical protein [Cryobacterium sp. CAN_C3]MEC5155834.1 hypothetical protein [Cryobacterium sp. CAN_C3]